MLQCNVRVIQGSDGTVELLTPHPKPLLPDLKWQITVAVKKSRPLHGPNFLPNSQYAYKIVINYSYHGCTRV
jgi:hypothetical protein